MTDYGIRKAQRQGAMGDQQAAQRYLLGLARSNDPRVAKASELRAELRRMLFVVQDKGDCRGTAAAHVPLEPVLPLLREALENELIDDCGYAFGKVVGWGSRGQRVGVLAFRTGDEVVIATGGCYVNRKFTPGLIWYWLQPWGSRMKPETRAKKLHEWSDPMYRTDKNTHGWGLTAVETTVDVVRDLCDFDAAMAGPDSAAFWHQRNTKPIRKPLKKPPNPATREQKDSIRALADAGGLTKKGLDPLLLEHLGHYEVERISKADAKHLLKVLETQTGTNAKKKRAKKKTTPFQPPTGKVTPLEVALIRHLRDRAGMNTTQLNALVKKHGGVSRPTSLSNRSKVAKVIRALRKREVDECNWNRYSSEAQIALAKQMQEELGLNRSEMREVRCKVSLGGRAIRRLQKAQACNALLVLYDLMLDPKLLVELRAELAKEAAQRRAARKRKAARKLKRSA